MKSGRLLQSSVYAIGGLYTLLFLLTATMRLLYPFEVEWNEGAILDHALRVLDGKQIYSAPSLDFSAFIYTPFYYYLTAVVMKFGGVGLWSGRAISIAATLATTFFAGTIVKRETSSTFLAAS